MDLAEMLNAGFTLPHDMPSSLDARLIGGNAPSAFPNGCHICEVEIDPETGESAVVRYTMVNDFGVIVNPLLVEGQAHGGIVQGIGQALKRIRSVYDADGQLMTGSYHGLCPAARRRCPLVQFRQPSRTGENQPARRQGMRRSWLRGLAPVGHERNRRCAFGIRHYACGYAGNAASCLGRHSVSSSVNGRPE